MKYIEKFYERAVKERSANSTEELLDFISDSHGSKVQIASSLGAEDVVLIDIMKRRNLEIDVFTIDTGRLNQETYDLVDEISTRYEIKINILLPEPLDVKEMVEKKGMNLFYESTENRKLCCNIRKVQPLNRHLSGLDAWISGIRSEQNQNRLSSKRIELEHRYKLIIKYNPLLEWTYKQIFDYIKENNVPYNKLHDLGYPSIGCLPCTRSVQQGDKNRSGRWYWEEESNTECGLHEN